MAILSLSAQVVATYICDNRKLFSEPTAKRRNLRIRICFAGVLTPSSTEVEMPYPWLVTLCAKIIRISKHSVHRKNTIMHLWTRKTSVHIYSVHIYRPLNKGPTVETGPSLRILSMAGGSLAEKPPSSFCNWNAIGVVSKFCDMPIPPFFRQCVA